MPVEVEIIVRKFGAGMLRQRLANANPTVVGLGFAVEPGAPRLEGEVVRLGAYYGTDANVETLIAAIDTAVATDGIAIR